MVYEGPSIIGHGVVGNRRENHNPITHGTCEAYFGALCV